MDKLSKKELTDLLNKCWMTHDGMWFFHCLQEFGIEATNRINKSAIQSLASIEIKRIQNALGFEKNIEDHEDFRAFFEEASKLMIPDFMNVSFRFPEKNVMEWEFNKGKCFAYKGVNRLGVIDEYECGVLYRIKCWLDAFKIKYTFDPESNGCNMPLYGNCSGKVQFEVQDRG